MSVKENIKLIIGSKIEPKRNLKNSYKFDIEFMLGDGDVYRECTVIIHEDNPYLLGFVDCIENHSYGTCETLEDFIKACPDFNHYTVSKHSKEVQFMPLEDFFQPTATTPIVLDWLTLEGENYAVINSLDISYLDKDGIAYYVTIDSKL